MKSRTKTNLYKSVTGPRGDKDNSDNEQRKRLGRERKTSIKWRKLGIEIISIRGTVREVEDTEFYNRRVTSEGKVVVVGII